VPEEGQEDQGQGQAQEGDQEMQEEVPLSRVQTN
jgi:hypothetical protein